MARSIRLCLTLGFIVRVGAFQTRTSPYFPKYRLCASWRAPRFAYGDDVHNSMAFEGLRVFP